METLQMLWIHGVKMLDMSVLGCYYLLGAILLSILINKVTCKKNAKEMGTLELAMSVCWKTSLVMVLAYALRSVIKRIPFPLDGIYGFEHGRLKEVKGGIIIAFAVITSQPVYGFQVRELIERLNIFFESSIGV